jgi:hypothetical protein
VTDPSTTLEQLLVEAWRQSLVEGRAEVEWAGHRARVGRTRSQGLRTVALAYGEHRVEGIEQNPEKASRWGELAREGKRIMQFRYRNRYVGNVCEGVVVRYPAWRSLGLPD